MGKSLYPTYIDAINHDYSSEVVTAFNACKEQLDRVKQKNLEGADRALPEDLKEKIDGKFTQFQQEKGPKQAEMQALFNALKQRHLILLLAGLASIIVGVFTAAMGIGLFLIIIGIVLFVVRSKMDEKEAAKLSKAWKSFFISWANQFGEAETYQHPATGLYAQVDELYLKSLSEVERGTEMQIRTQNKNSQAQMAQAQAAMQAQQAFAQAQMAANAAMMRELKKSK